MTADQLVFIRFSNRDCGARFLRSSVDRRRLPGKRISRGSWRMTAEKPQQTGQRVPELGIHAFLATDFLSYALSTIHPAQASSTTEKQYGRETPKWLLINHGCRFPLRKLSAG